MVRLPMPLTIFAKKVRLGSTLQHQSLPLISDADICFIFCLLACLFDQQIMRSGFNCVFLDTPLIIASLLDDSAELLKVLVQYGAYLDFRSEAGYTALHNVAMIGRIETLEVGFICFEKRFLCCYRKS